MLTIDTPAKFEQWLTENGWFEDARILSIAPLPKSEQDSLPSTVTVELAYQIKGNHKAHSTRVSRAFRLVANDINEYHMSGDGSFTPEHWSEGIEILESDSVIAFKIDVPAILTLRCGVVTVEALPNLIETVKPWLSDREVYAKILSATLPTPAEWVNMFERFNQNVSWHIYGGESRPHSEVPQSNYEGWFLQIPEALDEKHQGVFFFACKPNGDGFRVQVKNHGASESLWHATMVILGQFKDVEVRCGNCEFHGAEWLEQLAQKDAA